MLPPERSSSVDSVGSAGELPSALLKGLQCILERLSPAAQRCTAALREEGFPGTLSAACAGRWGKLIVIFSARKPPFSIGGGLGEQGLCVHPVAG